VEGAERGRGIGESKTIKRPFISKVACLSHRSSLARLLPRYAPGSSSSPAVNPTSRSISRLFYGEEVCNQSGYLFLMVRLPS